MHTHDDQPVVLVPLVPRLGVRQRAQTVDAGIRPEIDHDDLAAQSVRGQRWRVEPGRRAIESRQLTLDRQLARYAVGMRRRIVVCLQRIDQRLLEAIRARIRHLGEHTRIPTERDGENREQHRGAEPAPQPIACIERALERRKDAPTGQRRQGKRDDRAERVGNNSKLVWTLAPLSAAPVRMSPRIGPAHGAQRKPVAMPRTNDCHAPALEPPAEPDSSRRLPSATNGRVKRSANDFDNSAAPKTASSTSANIRPNELTRTAQLPPSAASVATPANVTPCRRAAEGRLRKEGPAGTCEDKRQHRQDARTQ